MVPPGMEQIAIWGALAALVLCAGWCLFEIHEIRRASVAEGLKKRLSALDFACAAAESHIEGFAEQRRSSKAELHALVEQIQDAYDRAERKRASAAGVEHRAKKREEAAEVEPPDPMDMTRDELRSLFANTRGFGN